MEKQRNIRLYNADCIVEMQKLESESVNCILTDPPYLYLKNQKLDRPFDEQIFFNEAKRVLKKDGFIVLFGRGTSFYRWNCILADLGFNFKEEIIWNKSMGTSPLSRLNRIHETIVIYSAGNASINKVKVPYLEMKGHDVDSVCQDTKRMKAILNNTKSLDAVLNFLENNSRTDRVSQDKFTKYRATCDNRMKGDRAVDVLQSISNGLNEKSIIKQVRDHYSAIHPTQKPVRLLERLLALVTQEGDLVLDPFSGSGSTALACINTKRRFIGYEIDEEYYNGANNRIDSHLQQIQPQFF